MDLQTPMNQAVVVAEIIINPSTIGELPRVAFTARVCDLCKLVAT